MGKRQKVKMGFKKRRGEKEKNLGVQSRTRV